MWLMTTFGYFSVVQKLGTTGLTIRARVPAELARLREIGNLSALDRILIS